MVGDALDISLTVNGEHHAVEVPARFLLLDVLRRELGYTSVKRGCDTGKCGACTVILDGEPAKSCSVLAGQADAGAVETVEGLDDPLGREIKAAYRRNHALQCGYCTSGFLASTAALLRETPTPDRAAVREALQGNVCRCTGYTRIVQAVEDAAASVAAADGGGHGGE